MDENIEKEVVEQIERLFSRIENYLDYLSSSLLIPQRERANNISIEIGESEGKVVSDRTFYLGEKKVLRFSNCRVQWVENKPVIICDLSFYILCCDDSKCRTLQLMYLQQIFN